MREILFKGKRMDNGEWVYGYYSPVNLPLMGCMGHFINEGGYRAIEIDPETVGQYTGLKDKNGTKIFEGDIVRHCNDNPYGDVEKGQVFWDEVSCGWRRTSNGAFHHGKIDTYRMSPTCVYEVIGNIHDNPELMEVQK